MATSTRKSGITLFGWVAIISSVISSSMADNPLGRNFQEPCTEADPCNPIKFLECKKGKCECTIPKETIYDAKRQQCVAMVGFSCVRPIPGQKKAKRSSVTNDTEQEVVLGPYQIACVANAKCSYPDDLCACEFRYYKAPNATCLKQKGFGERCSRNEECDQYRFLSCSGGVCTCDKNHKYDAKNQKCMVSVGQPCKIINYRSINLEHYFIHECPQNAHCRLNNSVENTGICQCESGFKITLDKTCGRDYGDKCSSEDKCSDVQFMCRNGICQCKYPLHQYYDEKLKTCVSHAFSPCDSKSVPNDTVNEPVPIGCTENAVCHVVSPFSFCKCLEGYAETNDGKCMKGHGTRCERDEECDPVAELACINNACNCPDKLQTYDEKHRTCIGLVGGKCRKDATNGATLPSCTANAYCVKTNQQMDFGRCVCARGLSTTLSRTCSKGS